MIKTVIHATIRPTNKYDRNITFSEYIKVKESILACVTRRASELGVIPYTLVTIEVETIQENDLTGNETRLARITL